MSEELKPCKCGGNVELTSDYYDGEIYSIVCHDCNMVFQMYTEDSGDNPNWLCYDKELLIKTWNARPLEDALQSRIRELEGNIEAYEHDLPLLKAAERIAELERAQRWTSIETLPEQDGVYLGWCKQEKLHAMFVFRVEWTVGVDNRITHWMPLPSIPESEDK